MDLSPDDDNFQGRLLHQAALWDNVELLQELLASGAEVDARDSRQRTALHAAALADRSRCLRALVAAGADLDAKADDAAGGKTALHIAAERGHVENIHVLVGAGASLSAVDAAGDCALALADRHGHRHAAMALREHRDALERERLSQHAALRELVVRGDVQQLRAKILALGKDAGLIVNLAPGGANTLLYVASESGQATLVSALLEAGADGRAHPVTRYGPLYVACYQGHSEVARLLLAHHPAAVQQETVEKWLPLHAACIGGHAALVTLLLNHTYPEHLLNTYTDESGQLQYRAAFDINARDVSGQSALYVACTLANLAVVDALLACTVPVCRLLQIISSSEPEPESPTTAKVLSPQRAGISLGIHAIVSKLTGSGNKQESSRQLCPVHLNAVVGGDSCVGRAVAARHARLLRRLLRAGANADAPAIMPSGVAEAGRGSRRRSRSASAHAHQPHARQRSIDRDVPWTALALAARLGAVPLAELLLEHGATDPGAVAAREAAISCPRLLPDLLATKAYPDPDYKLNKSAVSESVFSSRSADSALTYSALCPTTAVMVTWRELRCQLAELRMSWLRTAALRVNKKMSSPGGALLALTRLDVANNELQALPPELFTLLSIRYINAAQNKLDRLPRAGDPYEEEGTKRSKKKPRPEVYSAPVLQELYLQDNRIEEIPPELFRLPSLQSLDVSNNKLRYLPGTMWTAPSLRDLNAAFNHLRDLPTDQDSECPSPSQPPSGLTSPVSETADQGRIDSKSSSRSPSIECSTEDVTEDDNDAIVIPQRGRNTICTEAKRAHSWRTTLEWEPAPEGGTGSSSAGGSRLSALNLAHNQLGCVPAVLACRAPALLRLNMAYNCLRSMSYVTSYPPNLRQLDLSHNEITCWPSLPQLETFGSTEDDPLACYCPPGEPRPPRPRAPPTGAPGPGGSLRAQLLRAACPPRRRLRMTALRTLILSNNLLTRIQLTTDDDGLLEEQTADQDNDDWEQEGGTSLRSRLLFPHLSMLDVSYNLLKAVPAAIHALQHLAVLNVSGNREITTLPPQLGLVPRLWSVSASGCSLGPPLAPLLAARRCGDLLARLRATLTDARHCRRLRLMLVGSQGIGKTTLLQCLRQESALQHRRKPTDHWAKRMGNKSSRQPLSTVGVDIGSWVYEKPRSSRGPVTFRTWDFGGQREYYATHQYFLSRRSLYLVLWRAPDGRQGLADALQWLRSIQARAPGSSVIMVATHYDQVDNSTLPESESAEALQRLIRCHVMGAPDHDKRGLPRVVDSIEVSCSTRHNIRLLADIIYSVAFSIKLPGSKEPLLDQLVPASYLALEDCVTQLAQELPEPVLRYDEYKRLVTQYMQQKNLRMFRDAAELHHATMYLHENGVLLHYDDASLKELYFVRPQWLCDLLAHVVTVREVNPFAANGIMRTDDLAHVFKASPQLSGSTEEVTALALALLGKFELALAWDQRLLLVPPLLPDTPPPQPQLLLRSRSVSGARGTPLRAWPAALAASPPTAADPPAESSVRLSGRSRGSVIRRLLLLAYVPRGYWARLTARLLADPAPPALAAALYPRPPELERDEAVSQALSLRWGWSLWRTGLALRCGQLELLQLRELPAYDVLPGEGGGGGRFLVWSEGSWVPLETAASACVELILPAPTAVLTRADGAPLANCQSISLEPSPEVLAKMLALVSDHVDLLLEDWYPALGTRFVHTSEGRCLITRLVPCPQCLRDFDQQHDQRDDNHQRESDRLAQELRRLSVGEARARLSQGSRASDGDSGVGPDSNASSRVGSAEGGGGALAVAEAGAGAEACAWPLEECILAACTAATLACRTHGPLPLEELAPDALLLDVEESRRGRWEQVTRGAVVGRGAFGTVLGGRWRRPAGPPVHVAVKVLQPVPPPANALVADHHAYKAALSRWEREPVSAACRAYCALRQELAVLAALAHPHVLPLLAVTARPLALLLAAAPQGALDGVLRQYRNCGVRVGERAAKALGLQLARALEYLHANRVLYRDLKAENVLVWKMPTPQQAAAAELSAAPLPLHVKLGDYGISRMALPSGTKGFGGTEGFMAPEIMRYNGEEEYNEKVDCFSYGMVLYEVLSLRQPFEGHEAVKEAILEGSRPSLTARELSYPVSLLETMRRCWSARPERRPAAAALVAALAAPEAAALADGASAPAPPTAAQPVPLPDTAESPGGWEVWLGGGEAGRVTSLVMTRSKITHQHSLRLLSDKEEPVSATAMCRVGNKLWFGDNTGRVSVYSASSCALLWSVRVQDAVGGASSACAALLPLPALHRVALALQCGRLFLVTSQRPEAEGSFVLTELGTATELCCLAAVSTPHGVEVWAGGDGLQAYPVGSGGVRGAYEVGPVTHTVTLLAAAPRQPLVLAACRPGSCVYQWSAVSRQLTARLDCSKLAPCSESLREDLCSEPCQVTALAVCGGKAYVGTDRGVLLVADVDSLRPLTVFRPYEHNITCIVPLISHEGASGPPMVATVGMNYRPLLERFAPSHQPESYDGAYCLLWRAHHWLPD